MHPWNQNLLALHFYRSPYWDGLHISGLATTPAWRDSWLELQWKKFTTVADSDMPFLPRNYQIDALREQEYLAEEVIGYLCRNKIPFQDRIQHRYPGSWRIQDSPFWRFPRQGIAVQFEGASNDNIVCPSLPQELLPRDHLAFKLARILNRDHRIWD